MLAEEEEDCVKDEEVDDSFPEADALDRFVLDDPEELEPPDPLRRFPVELVLVVVTFPLVSDEEIDSDTEDEDEDFDFGERNDGSEETDKSMVAVDEPEAEEEDEDGVAVEEDDMDEAVFFPPSFEDEDDMEDANVAMATAFATAALASATILNLLADNAKLASELEDTSMEVGTTLFEADSSSDPTRSVLVFDFDFDLDFDLDFDFDFDCVVFASTMGAGRFASTSSPLLLGSSP